MYVMNKQLSKAKCLTEIESLCQWLRTSHSRTLSDQLFTAYYNIVANYLLCYIRRKLGSSKAHLADEFLHDIMLKIFLIIKDERPQAAEQIQVLITNIQSSNQGVMFEKRTEKWGLEVNEWAEKSMSFPYDYSHIKSPTLDNEAKQINEFLNPLKLEGSSIVTWLETNKKNTEEDIVIITIDEIIELLPNIRIPLKTLLYMMARNKVIDHWRKKSTQNETALQDNGDDGDENSHTSIDKGNEFIYQEWLRQGMTNDPSGYHDKQQEIQQAIDFCLQTPIRDATEKLQQATTKQQKRRCEDRLETLYSDYIEQEVILQMMKERYDEKNRYTQNDIAEKLGLTRNQVVYRQDQIKALLTPLKTAGFL